MKGKFQQLQTSRDLIFELNLNKHPKDCKNLSLVDAKNIQLSEDLSAIQNTIIEEKGDLYYKLYNIYGGVEKDNKLNCIIVGTINCIKELVLFIKNSNEDLHIYRYKDNVLSSQLIRDSEEYFLDINSSSYNPEFTGTYTYNRNDELIVAYCFSPTKESKSIKQFPLSIANLGKWSYTNNEYNIPIDIIKDDLNLNVNTFPICPFIPKITSSISTSVGGILKQGWYTIFCRFKIDKHNYTKWVNINSGILIAERQWKNIFDYKCENQGSLKMSIMTSDDLNYCRQSLNIQIDAQTHVYKFAQIAFICNSKTYTDCRISNDFEVFDNDFEISVSYINTKEYDLNKLIKIYNNYYNVKNIINYKNQLYISNYEEYNFDLDFDIKTNINEKGFIDTEISSYNDVDLYFNERKNYGDYVSKNIEYELYLHKINDYGEISNGKFITKYNPTQEETRLRVETNYYSLEKFKNTFISFNVNYNLIYLGGYIVSVSATQLRFFCEYLNFSDSVKISYSHLIIDNVKYKIESIEYIVAGSIIDNNYSNNTHFLISFRENLETYSYKDAYLIDETNNYNNDNIKTLIRCLPNIQDYGRYYDLNFYMIRNTLLTIHFADSYRLNHYNRIISDTEINNLITTRYCIFVSDEILNYLQINNDPQIYATIQNDVDYDNPDVKIYNSKIFLIQDCVDLLKNNIPKYKDVCLITYLSKDDLQSITIYNKTIRRSNYISDESLELSWRNFETENYKSIIENKGNIVNLIDFGNTLLIHTEHSLFQINLDETIVANNRNIQLSSIDAFNVQYKEIFTDKNGIGGLSRKSNAISGKFGYIYYSQEDNRFYRYDNGKLITIDDNINLFFNCMDEEYKNIYSKNLSIGYDKRRNIILFNNTARSFIYHLGASNFIGERETFKNLIYKDTFQYKDLLYNYSTFTDSTILLNNGIDLYYNSEENNKHKLSTFSIIINNDYNKVKVLEYITYKLYKVNLRDKRELNREPYSGYKLRVYNDMCDTGLLDIQGELKLNNTYEEIDKPTYYLGNFNMSYLRDEITNSQIFGNYFIVEFRFPENSNIKFEFESLNYAISEK